MPAVNKRAIAAAFGRAAGGYEHYAELQWRCGNLLLHRLADRTVTRVLDAGCGTGWYSRYWQHRRAEVTALDLSGEMLAMARQQASARHFVLGDIEHLPLISSQFDLVWSNLAVQWCEALPQALNELLRVTTLEGCVAFTTLCAGSLPELDSAWRAVDDRPHANPFLTPEAIRAACPLNAHLTLEPFTITLRFANALSAMRSLKGVGATHLHAGRQVSLLTRERLNALCLAWPQCQGQFTLTYHLISGILHHV